MYGLEQRGVHVPNLFQTARQDGERQGHSGLVVTGEDSGGQKGRSGMEQNGIT